MIVREWEFDSHLDVIQNDGRKDLRQVWSRPSCQWWDTFEWTLTPDVHGQENPPLRSNCGHWTSTEAFKKHFPYFERNDQTNQIKPPNDKRGRYYADSRD